MRSALLARLSPFLAASVFAVSAPASAQPKFEALSAAESAAEKSAIKLKRTGAGVAIVGALGMTTGIVLMAVGDHEAEQSRELFAGMDKKISGALVLSGGAAVTLLGLHLLSKGRNKLDKLRENKTTFVVAPNTAGGMTAAIGGRF